MKKYESSIQVKLLNPWKKKKFHSYLCSFVLLGIRVIFKFVMVHKASKFGIEMLIHIRENKYIIPISFRSSPRRKIRKQGLVKLVQLLQNFLYFCVLPSLNSIHVLKSLLTCSMLYIFLTTAVSVVSAVSYNFLFIVQFRKWIQNKQSSGVDL